MSDCMGTAETSISTFLEMLLSMDVDEACSYRLLLYEGGERGTVVPHGLQTIADAIVPDGWYTTIAALVEFTGIFLPPSFILER
jgi:hypothetical protein